MISPLPDPHGAGEARLLAFIEQVRIKYEILRPNQPMPTVPLAAAAIGVEESQIIKSVIFVGAPGTVVLAIACGASRINRKRLSAITGFGKLRLADPETVLALTGFPAGGVSPIGHASALPVVIDSRVMKQEIVFGGAGSEHALLKISPADILRLTGASVGGITVDS